MKCTLKEWQTIYKNPKELIVQGTPVDGSSSWQEHPIGMAFQYLDAVSLGEKIQFGTHTRTVHCSMRDHTDNKRRKNHAITRMTILNTLKNNGISNRFTSSKEYFTSLPEYKFVISPEGNGVDCHRHYEALIAGCIPILEDNPLVIEKYKGLPILYTKDYSEITEEYLISIYDSMLNAQYDFSRIFLNYYPPNEISLIKSQSEYWCKRFVKRTFY